MKKIFNKPVKNHLFKQGYNTVMGILFILVFPLSSIAQFTVAGRILNKTDGKPVANAAVFLSNATTDGKTGANGSFALHNAKPGKYDLVISIIGFEPYSQPVTVDTNDIVLPDIEITQKTIVLNEVTIKPVVDKQRDRNFDWFKEEFLGRSYLAKDCKILNPEVLDLSYDDGTNVLTASSVDFLEIENPSLGYRVKYLLRDFKMDNKDLNARSIHFEGSVLFEKMQGTPAQEQKWEKNRQHAYEGSAMHFLRSALNDRLEDDGFRVLQLSKRPGAKKSGELLHFPLKRADIIAKTNQPGVFALGCDSDALHITYDKNHRFPKNGQVAHLENPDNKNVTIITFNTAYTLFDSNGGIINPNSISFTGAWGHDRVADLLPVDYEPAMGENKPLENKLSVKTNTQPDSLKTQLLALTERSDSLTRNFAAEKLYLQFDKPYYGIGDTIWFKAYLFNAPTLLLSAKSGLLHVDITTDSGKLVKQYLFNAKNGIGWGNIALDTSIFKSGNYTLHAYTNWMRNFGDGIFYSKHLYVAGSGENSWLINTKVNASNAGNKYQVNSRLQFTDINKTALVDKQLLLKVYAGTKNLYKQQVSTDANGMLDADFSLPQKAANLFIIAENKDDGKKAIIPLQLNRPENTDLQFMPEGGSLVAGLPAHIGFKAIGEDGKGTNISGIITDHEQKQVTAFQSIHNGMGSFFLDTQPSETYTAKVTLPDGKIKEYPLPMVKPSGIILNVTNPAETDSVTVSIAASKDLMQTGESYFLIGKSRGIICYAAVFSFSQGDLRRPIAKRLFPSGIAHFMITTTKGRPLNELLVFVDHKDKLNISAANESAVYAPHDSVTLHLNVTDNTGAPVSGIFSMAVTDDALIKQDTLNNDNIAGHLLLAGDLKGYVENPGYYLKGENKVSWQALDNLLLTQGWVNYDWQTDKTITPYAAESGFTVSGRVLTAFGGTIKGTHVQLLSKSPLLVSDTVTDKNGRFIFNNFPRVDTPAFVLKSVNKRGKSFNVGIVMDKSPDPIFKSIYPGNLPWYVSSDAVMVNYAKNKDSINNIRDNFEGGGHRLKEVKIVAPKIVHDSQNLNGTGNADLVLDEKDMIIAGKKSWLNILQEKVPGFHDGNLGLRYHYYFVHDKMINIVIDGILLDIDDITGYHIYASNPDTYQFYLDNKINFLKDHSAEDIKGIEVNASRKYNIKYSNQFYPDAEFPPDYAYIEITTRSHRGPYLDNQAPGLYLDKPLAISWPKQFYKPKYAVKDTSKTLPTLRSTIDWEPNIYTDKDGNATVSFYAADKPGTYTLIIEGTDGNGNIGYKTTKIKIEGKQTGPPKDGSSK